MLTLDMICQAQHRLRGLLHRTPLVHSATLSNHLGAQVYLKLEFLQIEQFVQVGSVMGEEEPLLDGKLSQKRKSSS